MTCNPPIKTFLIRELTGKEYVKKGGIPPGQTAHNCNYHKIDLRKMSYQEAENLHAEYVLFHEKTSRLKNSGCKPAPTFAFIGKLRQYGFMPNEKDWKEILRRRKNQKYQENKMKITQGINRRSDLVTS